MTTTAEAGARRGRRVLRAVVVTTAMTVTALLALVAVLAVAIVAFYPPPLEPFDPVAWHPPDAMTVGPDLVDPLSSRQIRPLIGEAVPGPEDIAVDDAGAVYIGTSDGVIRRILPGHATSERFADVGGRPLGLQFDRHGNLLVANHGQGLQSVAPDGTVTLLTDSANGEPIRSANDVTVADDGTVYLTDSSSRYNSTTLGGGTSFSLYDFLEGRPYGRLLRYDPTERTTTELRRDLYFPNGLVLTPDQNAVLVAESTRFRITKHWLGRERSGTSETFLDAVPGVLDGITRQGQHLLLPMYDRPSLLDLVLPSAFARGAAIRLAPVLLTGDGDPLTGSILVLTENGEVIRHITGIPPAPANIAPHGDTWLLGTLSGHQVRVMPNPLRGY